MKTKAKIFAILTVLILMFSLTACSKTKTKWSVEGVYCESLDLEAGSIYRYNVKQIELLADANVDENDLKSDKVIKISTDFKYYYSSAKLSSYHFTFTDTNSFYGDEIPECVIASVFDRVTYKRLSGSGYQAYYSGEGKYVKIRVVIDGLDTVYRPEVTEKGKISTVTFNELDDMHGLSLAGKRLFKTEVASVEYEADYENYLRAVADNANNDSAVKKLEEDFDKKYKYAAVLEEYKFSFDTSATPMVIVYSGEKK